ncbi:MAG: hypothetical protein LBL41_03665 [Bifidobacteriaceae bacterium]|jgi:hypothetical protein|nr:hypothetical protein [Bifidobacteriaceae bacterium]
MKVALAIFGIFVAIALLVQFWYVTLPLIALFIIWCAISVKKDNKEKKEAEERVTVIARKENITNNKIQPNLGKIDELISLKKHLVRQHNTIVVNKYHILAREANIDMLENVQSGSTNKLGDMQQQVLDFTEVSGEEISESKFETFLFKV